MAAQPQRPASVRRRFPRRIFRRGIGVLSAGKYFIATGCEIGEGGVSFTTDTSIRIGGLVVLSFQIPDGQFISVRAEVRNEAKNNEGHLNYGTAFETVSFERKREIRNFVTNRPESEI
ncbi:MAG: hypothetical protein C5B49_07005 [Bdellovibrio sp.]|nr:MAG: hypothetical protein C5B49_07005 [Bdellovibrio sp.]